MPKLADVCRYVRSKNAGPFWVTIDLFFASSEAFRRYKDDASISADSMAAIYGVDPRLVRRFVVETLNVVKITMPRTAPQGGPHERDMHSGQSYVRLLDLALK